MSKHIFLFCLIALIPQAIVAQVQAKLTRDQRARTSLEVRNGCRAPHTYELSVISATNVMKLTGARSAIITPGTSNHFPLEFNSSNLDPGIYRADVEGFCVDCASTEPGCRPARFATPFTLKVVWSMAQLNNVQAFVPAEVLVTMSGTIQDVNRLLPDLERTYQLRRLAVVPLSSTQEIMVLFGVLNPGQSLADLIVRLQENPLIDSAQHNYIYTASQAQSQNYESLQFGPKLIGADLVSGYSTGKGIRIALIDTGIDDSHKDLKGKIVERKNFTDDKEYRRDVHGTSMAGIISAIPGNGFGINGVAPGARIVSIKVLTQKSASTKPTGTAFTMAQGLDFAITQKVNIANLSCGTPNQDPRVANLVKTAVSRGIVVVAAAGQQGGPSFPAVMSEVIAVAAVDRDRKAYASGVVADYIDVAAPGVGILSTQPGNTFHDSDGTSAAAAHVTGLVALLLEQKPNTSPAAIQDQLEKNATDLGPRGKDPVFGSGLVDACKSLRLCGKQNYPSNAKNLSR